MKLTKYQHACFTVELDGQTLLVDPGEDATDAPLDSQIDIVYFTHEHEDHCSIDNLKHMIDHNQNIIILGNDAVADKLQDFAVQIVKPGDSIDIESFSLQFTGEIHARVHNDIPPVKNLGIIVNNSVYYPGDSFAPCSISPAVLLLPISGNWMKIQDAIDLLHQLQPQAVMPTHHAPLSDVGKRNALHWVEQFANRQQTQLLDVSSSIEITSNSTVVSTD